MAIVIRQIDRSEFDRFQEVSMHTFGGEVPEGESRLLKILDLERTYVAFDGDDMVGTAGAYSHQLAVPGSRIPMAGLTIVAVRPTHRRRGVLRAMVERHNEDMAQRGEVISGLWSSESSIYPRFGYGVAAESHILETDANYLHFDPGFASDEIRFVDAEQVFDSIAPLYESVAKVRPGTYARSESWWRNRTLYDGADRRGGASSMRVAVARRDDAIVGYVVFRQSFANDRGILDGSVSIVELVGGDLQAEKSLWHFVCHLDLYPKIKYWNAPLDCPLPWLVDDRRRVRRLRADTLWLHLRDPQAALEARSYQADGTLGIVLDADDAKRPTTRITMEVSDGTATCRPLEGSGDIHLGRQDLSSLYLGAFRASELASVGRLRGEPAAIARADSLFGWPRIPWCPEIF